MQDQLLCGRNTGNGCDVPCDSEYPNIIVFTSCTQGRPFSSFQAQALLVDENNFVFTLSATFEQLQVVGRDDEDNINTQTTSLPRMTTYYWSRFCCF